VQKLNIAIMLTAKAKERCEMMQSRTSLRLLVVGAWLELVSDGIASLMIMHFCQIAAL
jgi:hypothetical protein